MIITARKIADNANQVNEPRTLTTGSLKSGGAELKPMRTDLPNI